MTLNPIIAGYKNLTNNPVIEGHELYYYPVIAGQAL